MNKAEAYNKITYYLKAHFIKFHEDDYENTKRLTMAYKGYSNCPKSIIESCIYFFSDCMECRVYYTELGSDICKKSTHMADLCRLLNYINATIWPCTSDGTGGEFYQPYHLYTPRIYVTEDGCFDITSTTVIPYDFYDVAVLETEDYMTACIPELMDKLSPAIFGVLSGKITAEDAIEYVKTTILNED